MMIMGMPADTFSTLMFVLILGLLLGVVPARIAKKKGYSFAGFYLFGLFLFIPAVIVALILTDRNAAEAPASSAADEIAKYKQLLDSGAITEQEFEAKKAELLK